MMSEMQTETETAVGPLRVKSLPGPVRPAQVILDEIDKSNARIEENVRERFPHVKEGLWALLSLYQIDKRKVFRWKARLACGCVIDTATPGEDPARLTDHTLPCMAIQEHPQYRPVVRWENRREENSHSAIEEIGDRRLAHWDAVLECGHVSNAFTDLDWDPADGPKYADPERIARLRREWKGSDSLKRLEPSLDRGWPRPDTVEDCWECRMAQPIIEYAPLGLLVRAPKVPSPASKRAAAQRRLKAAEADAERARKDLERLEDGS